MEPLFQTQFLHNDISGRGDEEEQIASSGYEEDESGDRPNVPTTPALKLSRAQQAQVAQMIGDTMVRLNRFADAVGYYESARRIENTAIP
jgi:hypothetical protein